MNKLLKVLFAISIILNIVLALNVSAASTVSNFVPTNGSTQSIQSSDQPFAEVVNNDNVFKYVNEYRLSKNLPTLSGDLRLCKIAQTRLDFQKSQKTITHSGFLEIPKMAGERMGENLAFDFNSASAVVSSWKTSPTHNENLLASWATSGCIKTDGNIVVLIVSNQN